MKINKCIECKKELPEEWTGTCYECNEKIKDEWNEIEIAYLQVLVMPNGEILCEGKKVGMVKNLEKYLVKQDKVQK